jgi:hypothetical protein
MIEMRKILIFEIQAQLVLENNISGVTAKLLDSPSHFSKFEIFREPQLNTYLKGMQKRY